MRVLVDSCGYLIRSDPRSREKGRRARSTYTFFRLAEGSTRFKGADIRYPEAREPKAKKNARGGRNWEEDKMVGELELEEKGTVPTSPEMCLPKVLAPRRRRMPTLVNL